MKNKTIPEQIPVVRVTVQGGVGTAQEHHFLLDYYKVDAVGWGSPFLLVPEATSVDKATRALIAGATEKDLYLSAISPLESLSIPLGGPLMIFIKIPELKKVEPVVPVQRNT